MTANERSKITNILSNLFLRDYAFCADTFKATLVAEKKLPLDVINNYMCQPALLQEEDFSITVWLYNALSSSEKYQRIMPASELLFTPEDLKKAQEFVYIPIPKKKKISSNASEEYPRPSKKVISRKKVYEFTGKNDFLSEIAKDKSETEVNRIYATYGAIFSKLEETEKFLGKEVNEFNYEEFRNLFIRSGWTSNSSFFTRKSHLKSYIMWLSKSKGIIIEDDREIPIAKLFPDCFVEFENNKFKQKFFGSYEELRETIETVFNTEQYDMIKLLCYLCWFGFTSEEACEMLKTDVNYDNCSITNWETGYTVNNLPEEVMALCHKCSSSLGFTRIVDKRNTEINYTYKNNKYLIRSLAATDPKTARLTRQKPISNIFINRHYVLWRTELKRFSIMDNIYNKELSVEKIYRSGIYSRLYEYEMTNKTEIFQEDINMLCRGSDETKKLISLPDYIQWKNSFYGK